MENSNVYMQNLESMDGIAGKVRDRLSRGVQQSGFIVFREAMNNSQKHISAKIHLGDVQINGNEFSIEVFVNLSDAPDARAWEYGSGLHATKGTPGKYPIAAKNVPNLVFFWENRNKWFVGPRLPIGHPGIVGRSYLRPALWNNIQTIKTILAKSVTGEYYG